MITRASNPRTRSALITAVFYVLIIWFFYFVVAPNFVRHGTSEINGIINNLRQLDAAKHQWAFERGDTNPVSVAREDLAPYMKDGWVKPIAGEEYTLNRFPDFPEARLTRRVEGHPKGTIIRDLEIIEPK